jgi:hypothetical protein
VTIAVGFWSSEGIVIAADREETVGHSKHRVGKIVAYRSDNYSIVFAGAGDADLIEIFWDGCLRQADRLSPDEVSGDLEWGSGIRRILGEQIRDIFDKNIAPAIDKPQIEALVGVQTGEWNALFYVAPPHRVVPVETNNHRAIGIGIYAANGILERLHSEPLDTGSTVDLAIYVLDHVKRQIVDCGGSTDITILRRNGQIDFIPDQYVEAAEERFKRFDASVKTLFLSTVGESSIQKAAVTSALDVMANLKKSMPKRRYKDTGDLSDD